MGGTDEVDTKLVGLWEVPRTAFVLALWVGFRVPARCLERESHWGSSYQSSEVLFPTLYFQGYDEWSMYTVSLLWTSGKS